MKSIIILSVLVVAAFGYVRKPIPFGRIVGGEDAEISDFQYQLSFQMLDLHICGASVIGKRWVLTAAHCLEDMKLDWLTFRAGSRLYNEGGIVFKAVEMYSHPEYVKDTMDNDVALILVDKDLVGHNINPIKLPTIGAEVKAGTLGTVSGWGSILGGSHDTPQILQYVNVHVVEQEKCNSALKRFGGVREMSYCANDIGKDSCQGDSGGPMVIDDIQVGVVSWGVGCAIRSLPGVYARLSNPVIREWISKTANI